MKYSDSEVGLSDLQYDLLDRRQLKLLKKFGLDYLLEPLIERKDDKDLEELFRTYKFVVENGRDHRAVFEAFRSLVENYWRDYAIRECERFDEEWGE